MNKYKSLWVESYRPNKLTDLLLNEENRSFFSNINENTPHLLFHGCAGTGKTSLAKILVNDILKCQYLYINASDENGVDTIRNKVISFAQTKSLDGKKKIVILDEFCGTTAEAQRILRNVMEEYSENVRFILTANYIERIVAPIKSRCSIFNLQSSLEDVTKRCCFILKNENITVPSDQKPLLVNHIQNCYPDLRRIINDLQKFSITGTLLIKSQNFIKDFSQEIYNLLLSKISSITIRKKIIEEENKFNSDYQLLLNELFECFYNSEIDELKKKNILLELGEYMYRDVSVIDKEINFFCCLISLDKVINS
jgi:replication factor C small subunit